MSILQYRSEELMNSRYKASEAKNQGDNLTHANKGLDSSHGIARMKVDAIRDKRILKDELDDWSHCKDIH